MSRGSGGLCCTSSLTALQDRLLARMTLHDFNGPLQTKLHGTRNLSQTFQSDALDFFVSLSSATAAVGTRGQANYTAGNTFQDAFAYGHTSPKTHYMSVSPGIIEGADINDGVRERNLRQHGLVPVSIDVLMSLLEYSMSPQARLDNCKHAIVGFTKESLSQVGIRNANVHSAMFSRVIETTADSQPVSGNDDPKSLKESIKAIKDPVQIKHLIGTATVKKLAELVSAQDTGAMLHKPLEDLGLDSLMTLELSDWTLQNCGVSIGPSELMNMDHASALADFIYDRSAIVKETEIFESDKAGRDNASELGTTSPPTDKGNLVSPVKGQLPALPLPDLENTLLMYQESLRSSRTSEELKVAEDAIQEFLDEGSGNKLQDRLRARADDPTLNSWQNELYASNIYLQRRDPVHPFTTFYGGHLLTENPIGQAQKAAIISAVAYNFRDQVLSGSSESDKLHGEALCKESWAWLFNACREPNVRADKMRKYPDNDHAVVLRRGHIFKIAWRDQTGTCSLSDLENALERIIELSQTWQLSASSLTADDRDSWAGVRQSLLSECSSNGDIVQTVEAAAFVVCLDDGSPETASERCNQFFFGDPSNRWSDKNLQFVVCDNGASALIGEHSMLDGLSVRKLQQAITAAILDNDCSTKAGVLPAIEADSASGNVVVEELVLVLDTALDHRISHIQTRFSRDFTPIEFSHYEVYAFGSQFLRKHGCASKSGYQLVIQLACLLYYGYQPPAWETISMARFHHGRVDWIQTVTPLVAVLCSSALDDTVSRTECRKLFIDAAIAHTNQVNRIARGHGFKAHLHALREVVSDDEPIPKLFQEPAWERTRVQSTKIVKTDCLEGMMLQETAFLMPTPECIFIHFEVKDDR